MNLPKRLRNLWKLSQLGPFVSGGTDITEEIIEELSRKGAKFVEKPKMAQIIKKKKDPLDELLNG